MRLLFPLLLAAGLVLSVGGTGSARTIEAEYSVRILGIPVGAAELRITVEDDRYAATFSGRVKGLARLLSSGTVESSVEGRIGQDRLEPVEYSHIFTKGRQRESVRIHFAGLDAVEVDVEPPPRDRGKRVPVAPEHLVKVLDPVTASIWPGGKDRAADLCSRVLPVFDGTRRFNLSLTFSRTATFRVRDSETSIPALVCAVRYRPVSGHLPEKRAVRFMQANEDIEIWIRADEHWPVTVPLMVRLRTELGRVVLEARDLKSD